MSMAFLAVGGALVFGRRWLTLDPASGSLTRRRGLLIPMQAEHRSLGEFNAVVMAFQAGDSESPDCYPVRLRAISGKDFIIRSPTKFEEGRAQAEFLSRFLRLPLADATTDHEVVVSPERASDTLQERLISSTAQTESVERPPGMRSQVSESGGKTLIVIPARKSRGAAAFAGLVSCVMMLIVAPALWRFFSRSDAPAGSRLLFLIIFVFLFGVLPLVSIGLAFGAVRNRTVVTASPSGLVIERRGLRRTRITEVSAAGILDVDYSTFEGTLESARRSTEMRQPASAGGLFAALKRWIPTKGIIVKSRQGLVTFGEGLAAEELRFLKWVLTKALAPR
jgi:hypothetical protein